MVFQTESLHRAIVAFEAAQQAFREISADSVAPENHKQTMRAGFIQHFEFCYEHAWKMMRRWLVQEVGRTDLEGISKKELYRIAFEEGLINDPNRWFRFHRARNETSHTYDEGVAQDVVSVAEDFLAAVRFFVAQLDQHIKNESVSKKN